jgi:hypothetical protein
VGRRGRREGGSSGVYAMLGVGEGGREGGKEGRGSRREGQMSR